MVVPRVSRDTGAPSLHYERHSVGLMAECCQRRENVAASGILARLAPFCVFSKRENVIVAVASGFAPKLDLCPTRDRKNQPERLA